MIASDAGSTATLPAASPATTPIVRISDCFRCGCALPLRSPVGAEVGIDWVCVGCGARFKAVRIQNCPAETRDNVRPAGFAIEFADYEPPPEALEKFLAKIRGNADVAKRYAPRQVTALGVAALPIDEHFLPCGEGFRSYVHAIDTEGAALLHVRQIRAPFLVLKIFPESPQATQVLLKVKLCTALGPFYEIDGPFVSKVGA